MNLHVLAKADKSKVLLMPVRDKTALFEGFLRIKDTPKGPRPYKFLVKKETEQYLPPEDAVRLLRKAKGIFIAKGDEALEGKFLQLLDDFQLSHKDIVVCNHCLHDRKITVIDSYAIVYKGGKICLNCALKELGREMEFRHIGRLARSHFERLLKRRRNLDDILALLSLENIDPEMTRYDVIPASQSGDTMDIMDLDVPPALKDILRQRLKKLLPVQTLAVQRGLLKGNCQLVVSATATGKSLIGEMAGIKNILEDKGKLLFLVPLVALANQKFDQLGKYRSIGLSTAIKVGVSRLKLSGIKHLPGNLDADIIVGTYEGIDQAIRTGRKLGRIGTVVIDEVHMLEDADRGHRLAGMIARLRFIAPNAQFVYLSATVGNPEALAKRLSADLVIYEVRPVPIERHLILTNEPGKRQLIRRLVGEARSHTSSTGFKGQTIIFTNSRKNCFSLARSISGAAAYHAGLQYHERKRIEEAFLSGKLDVVVTTAALAAGVDFPASHVIFESLAMGIEWLTVHEFNQMLGRAGRPGYHDRGLVYILAEPGRHFSSVRSEAEDEVALRLLHGEMEDVEPMYEEEQQLEEVLANATVAKSREDLDRLHKLTAGLDGLERSLKMLSTAGLLKGIGPTKIGRAASAHFLSPSQIEIVLKGIENGLGPLEVAVELEHFEALFLKAADRISVATRIQISQRALHGSFLDLIANGEIKALDLNLQIQCLNFAKDFMRCSCLDAPYCGCVERKVSMQILEMRSQGMSPNAIIEEFGKRYGIYAYQGDLINYLDQIVRYLEALEMVSKVLDKRSYAEEAAIWKMRIENG